MLAYIWMVNTDFWQGLPPDIRSELALIVDEVNAAVMTMAVEINASDRQRVLEKDPDKLIELSAEQLAQWRAAMKPVWDQFRDDIGEELINAALDSNNPQ